MSTGGTFLNQLPVPIAPELLIEIGSMAVVISKRGFALNPVYNVSLDGFTQTEMRSQSDRRKKNATHARSRRDK